MRNRANEDQRSGRLTRRIPYRLVLLFSCLGLGLLAPNHADARTGAKQAEAQQSIAASLENISTRYGEEAKRAERAEPETQNCGPSQYSGKAELCAQWKAADAAADSAWWAWVSGLATIVSTGAVLIAIGLTFQANRIARHAIEGQERPWVDFDVRPSLGFSFDEEGFPSYTVEICFKNYGPSPAIGLTYYPFMVFGDAVSTHIDHAIKQFRAGEIDWSDINLFPGKDWHRSCSASHSGENPGVVKVSFVVIAAYKTVFSKEPRFTVKAYDIESRDGSDVIDFRNLPQGKTATDISIKHHFAGHAT